MSMNEKIIGALAPLSIPVEPDIYTGEETTYCVFNYDTLPDDFGDNAPVHERYLVQVHLYSPYGTNTIALRRRIKELLYIAEFTWPEESNISNTALERAVEGQHYVFELEGVEGVGLDGEA